MNSLSMGYFVDYVLTSGTGKLTSVKQLKQGEQERFVSFYEPVREAIVDMHQRARASEELDGFAASRSDPREKRIYPKVVAGYKKFLKQGTMTWFEPPMRDYPLGPINVRVNPEIGLLIDGRPHTIKLYFRGDPVSPQRTMVVNQLLSNALAMTWPGTVFATLDVRRAKLYPFRPKSEIGLLLKAEAASLASLWSAL